MRFNNSTTGVNGNLEGNSMNLTIGKMLILFLLIVLISQGVNIAFSKQKSRQAKMLNLFASLLLVIGALGFFGLGFSALGGLNWLPENFEWPVGRAKNVVKTEEYYIVPHVSAGRIQIYNQELVFERGWNIEAGGGVFKLTPLADEQLIIYTARDSQKYTYSIEGELLAAENFHPGDYSSIEKTGIELKIPTSPLLLIFKNPFIAWVFMMAGMGVLFLKRKITG